MEANKPIRFFSKPLAMAAGIGAICLVVFVEGFSKFFISFGISPLGTLAQLGGMLVLPVVPTFFIARFIHKKKNLDFSYSWVIGTVIVCLVMGIGAAKGS